MQLKMLPLLDNRIPNWENGEFIYRKCPICHSDNFFPIALRPDGLTLCNCNTCTTRYINPSPTSKQLEKFYQNYYLNHAYSGSISVDKFSFETKLISPETDIRIQSILKFSNPFHGDKRALDIGCGKGQFLYLLKKIGFTVEGIEPDISAQRYANKIGINSIHSGYIDQFHPNKKYDLITMLDLIEHPLDPISLLRSAVDHLATDGYLLIWTPNGDMNHNDETNITFRVDLEHMQYLTKESCQHIAKTFNLSIAHLETLGIHEGFEHSRPVDKSLYKLNKIGEAQRAIKNFITNMPGWYSVIAPIIHSKKTKDFYSSTINKNYHLLCIFQKSSSNSSSI